jgi:hypothetical protein
MFSRITNWFSGRHTFFVALCMGIGVATAWFGKLDSNLVTLLLGLQGMVLSHSIKDDYHERNSPRDGDSDGDKGSNEK